MSGAIHAIISGFTFQAILLTILLTIGGCARQTPALSEPVLTLDQEQGKGWTFGDVCQLDRVLALETLDHALIGRVDLVRVDSFGTIYVGDYYSAKKLLAFDSMGNFLKSYGQLGRGPGEFEQLVSFALAPDGKIHLAEPRKIIQLDQDGIFVSEVKLEFHIKDITQVRDRLYAYVIHSQSSRGTSEVLVFDEELNPLPGIGTFDCRFQHYIYSALNYLHPLADGLLVLKSYELGFHLYPYDGSAPTFLAFAEQDAAVTDIWEKERRLTPNEEETVRAKLDHFISVIGGQQRVLLEELCIEKELSRHWLVDIASHRVLPMRLMDLDAAKHLPFAYLCGSYEEGVIGIIPDMHTFERAKRLEPALENVPFTEYSNPILLFYRFVEPLPPSMP